MQTRKKQLIFLGSLVRVVPKGTYIVPHSALKLEKSAILKVQKKHYLHFQEWQKINFCTR